MPSANYNMIKHVNFNLHNLFMKKDVWNRSDGDIPLKERYTNWHFHESHHLPQVEILNSMYIEVTFLKQEAHRP